MFQNRNNSQKLADALIADFKASFPDLHSASRSNFNAAFATPPPIGALDVAITGCDNETSDWNTTPRAITKQLLFTPSILDPNSFDFISFANEPPSYYKFTPGRTNTLEPPQTRDLHNSNFFMDLGTPLSIPTPKSSIHVGQPSTAIIQHGFPQHALASYIFQNTNPFALDQRQQSQYQHLIEGFVSDVEMQDQSPVDPFGGPSMDTQLRLMRPPQSAENFRYRLTLNAQTAMIKHPEEIPVSYLNKGQVYTVSIVDTKQTQLGIVTSKYRTYFRISFENEEQRLQAAACWQLWKDGRGVNEARNRGGRFQAVEFVGPNRGGSIGQSSRPRVELESISFDGFCVTWSLVQSGTLECLVDVRFNFLSTDFSFSKGVKGIPFRLCAKTQLVSSDGALSLTDTAAEMCFCKVKIFRDHGAERKFSNDISHIKKVIDKSTQQIARVQSETGGFVKAHKRRRTWSMSSRSDIGCRESQEEESYAELAALQDMLTSTRPTSVLSVRGEELDDPDLYPVYLSGKPRDLSNRDASMWDKQYTNTSSIDSPTLREQSLHPSDQQSPSTLIRPVPLQPPLRLELNEWQNFSQAITGHFRDAQHFNPPDVPVKIQKTSQDPDSPIGRMDVRRLEPPMRILKSIACFYVQTRVAGKLTEGNYYRAVYLTQRTLNDLISGIVVNIKIEPSKVLSTLRVNRQGLNIVLDDQAVKELPEGQDIVAEFQEIKVWSPVRREWDATPKDIQDDGELGVAHTVRPETYELRLRF